MHKFIARYRMKKEAQRLQAAVDKGEYTERPIDYIHDDVESIWGFERKMSGVEIESYKRIGRDYFWVPKVGTAERFLKHSFADLRGSETGDDEGKRGFWDLFYEAERKPNEGSCSAWLTSRRSEAETKWYDEVSEEHSGSFISAIFHHGQDTGIRLFISLQATSFNTPSGWPTNIERSCIVRISDCTMWNQPYFDQFDVYVPYKYKVRPFSVLAQTYYYPELWQVIKAIT